MCCVGPSTRSHRDAADVLRNLCAWSWLVRGDACRADWLTMLAKVATRDLRATFAQAAWRLGSTRGLAALTVRAIAKEIDVSAALLYAHFEDKDALIDELHRIAATRLADALDAGIALGDVDQLARLCSTYVAFVHEHQWLYDSRDLRGHTEVFTTRAAPLLDRLGVADATHLWLGVHGLATLTASMRDDESATTPTAALVARHIRLLLRGLGVREPNLTRVPTTSVVEASSGAEMARCS
jgi:AcrR family transcriptional regulator